MSSPAPAVHGVISSLSCLSFPAPVPHNWPIKQAPKVSKQRPERTPDLRLETIVRLLVNHATVVVSGTKIAQEIGSNRAEVWRLIQRLRELGVEIAGRPATGYRLESMPDLLLPDLLAPLVRGTLFASHIHHYYRIGSTNTAAMKAGAAGAPEGSAFVAEQQTEGRGRGAHTWHSAQSDGIYCSVLLRPSLSPSEALLLSLAAGLAVQAAVAQIDPQVNTDLKWPNDLLIQGKKFCGILTEMNAEVTRVRYLVIGVGVNVNHEKFPAELKQATSLRLATGTVWSRMELCAALLKSLDREYRMLLTTPDARQSIIRRFEAGSSSVREHEVEIEEDGGVSGVTAGLDPRGFLQIRTDKGIQAILSGTVRLK